MNENIDLTKILKDCPKGWEFWSPIFGKVEFERITKLGRIAFVKKDKEIWSFSSDARFPFGVNEKSVEIMLYPSEDQRDWSKFTAPWYKKTEWFNPWRKKVKKEKFDPKTLNPFDKVIGRDSAGRIWDCDFFSHIGSDIYPYRCVGNFYKCCIPYNDETKHLVGTTDEAPEYYRYWEDL